MYYFKTQGREYQFSLDSSDGLVHCKDLGLKAKTVEDLKPLVVAAVKAEKATPRIPVIILETRWNNTERYFFGSASGTADQSKGRWVSYEDEEGKKKRGKFYEGSLFLDTPENLLRVQRIVSLGKMMNSLRLQSAEIRRQMDKLTAKMEDDNVEE